MSTKMPKYPDFHSMLNFLYENGPLVKVFDKTEQIINFAFQTYSPLLTEAKYDIDHDPKMRAAWEPYFKIMDPLVAYKEKQLALADRKPEGLEDLKKILEDYKGLRTAKTK